MTGTPSIRCACPRDNSEGRAYSPPRLNAAPSPSPPPKAPSIRKPAKGQLLSSGGVARVMMRAFGLSILACSRVSCEPQRETEAAQAKAARPQDYRSILFGDSERAPRLGNCK